MSDRAALRLGGLSGIAFVIVVVVTVALMLPDAPDSGSTPRDVDAYYLDADKLTADATLSAFAGFFFIWFLGTLRAALRRAEGGDGALTSIATIGGVAYITLSLVTAAMETGYGLALDFFDFFEPDAGFGFLTNSLAFWLYAYASVGAAALVAATSLVALRRFLLPLWLGVGGVVIALLSLLYFVVPLAGPLLLVWILAVSVAMLTGRMARRLPASA